jgi:hypothetical protein
MPAVARSGHARPFQTAPPPARRRVSPERRRRERHYRLRRRDLLVDAGLAFALTIALISITAGLGVLALLELPIAAGLIASLVAERAARRRRRPARP